LIWNKFINDKKPNIISATIWSMFHVKQNQLLPNPAPCNSPYKHKHFTYTSSATVKEAQLKSSLYCPRLCPQHGSSLTPVECITLKHKQDKTYHKCNCRNWPIELVKTAFKRAVITIFNRITDNIANTDTHSDPNYKSFFFF
jgi:hypothetical protein